MSAPKPPSLRHLPRSCGVYLLRDAADSILYVGKAKDLSKRVAHYFNPRPQDLKTQTLAPLVRRVDYIPCASEREALLWERRLIGAHQPFFNSMWKDSKSYPSVKLTLQEEFPRLRVTRARRKDGALYFGPYPKVTPVRRLLRELWRRQLFPLRPCDWEFSSVKPLDPAKIQACLYYHTRQCPAPCAGHIGARAYRAIAEQAALFFKGDFARLRALFEGQMRAASASLRYEEAARLRDHLRALDHLAERVRCRELPLGRAEAKVGAARGVSDLQAALGLRSAPRHIECLDVSHLFGRKTVASSVCFTDGEPRKEHYRRMRIAGAANDDYAAMAQAVRRRCRGRPASDLPDLVLIDGGKGQLKAAQEALSGLGLNLPLAALAKREEELFLPGRTASLRLAKERPALHLVQRLRDEAHRFAVSYHRLLRRKELTP